MYILYKSKFINSDYELLPEYDRLDGRSESGGRRMGAAELGRCCERPALCLRLHMELDWRHAFQLQAERHLWSD